MKQSLKDFLLTLVISIVIFAVAAFFLITAAEGLMNDVVGNVHAGGSGKSSSDSYAISSESGEASERDGKVMTLLFVAMDDNKQADAIFLLGVDAEGKNATMVHIPGNTAVTEAGVTYRVSDLNGERQSGVLKSFVQEEVGVMPDYYVGITRTGLSNWVDFLGGIRCNVPRDMTGFEAAGNRKIELTAGDQTLSGDQVAQLLAFSGWTGNATARDDALLSFGKAFVGTVLRSTNLDNARKIYYNVSRHLYTNFTEKDFTLAGAALFHFNEFSPTIIRIPGSTDPNGYFSIATDRVKPLFEVYR